MPDPDKYERDFSFKGFQSGNPTSSQPGIRIDDELDNVSLAIGGLVAAVKDTRRSDGALKNGIVTRDSLSPALSFSVNGPTDAYIQAQLTPAAQAAAAAAVAAVGSAFASKADVTALNALATRRAPGKVSLADAIHTGLSGAPFSVACYGTSLTYGFVEASNPVYNAPGSRDPINGHPNRRVATPYPETLQSALFPAFPNAVVLNRGFPGDTVIDGLARWQTATPTSVAFLEYGTNETADYGAGTKTVAQFRVALSAFVERLQAAGTAVVILGAPGVVSDNNNGQAAKIQAFACAAAQVAAEFGVPFISVEQQIRWISNRWLDGVHFTAQGCAEWGAHLGALFASFQGTAARVAYDGLILYPEDGLITNGLRIGFASPPSRSGSLVQIPAGATTSFGVFCEQDLLPFLESVNVSGPSTPRNLMIRYGTSNEGVFPIALNNDGTGPDGRAAAIGPLLRRGYRYVRITNESAQDGFLSFIRFQRP